MKTPFLFILIIVLIWPGVVFSQDYYSIRGKVVDNKTNTPLAFAQVSLKNTLAGIATNADGQFELNVATSHINDSILVYYMGYKTFTGKISEMLSNENTIKLETSVVSLKEVEVVGLTAAEVIRRAVANIPANYGAEPLILTAFIRVQKMVNNKLAEYAEAVVDDLKDGYYLYKPSMIDDKHRKSNLPAFRKGRVRSDTALVNSLDEVGKNAYCLSCYFTRDIVEFYPKTFLDEKEFHFYNYQVKEMVTPEEGKIYHITFDQKDKLNESLWRGELFIAAEDFAIVKVILKPSLKGYDKYNNKTKYQKTYTIRGTPGWIQEMPLGQTIVTYANTKGKWHLNTIRNDYWMTYTQPYSGKMLKYGYKDDVVVTDISTEPEKIRTFTGDRSKGINERWDQVAGHLDETFWARYNYLPIEESLKSSIDLLGGK